MPATLLDFVATASKGLVECSINDLRALAEFEGLGGLASVSRVKEICDQARLVCNPPLDDGELETVRTFRSEKGGEDGPQLFEAARRAGEGHLIEFKQTLGLNVGRLAAQPDAAVNVLFDERIVHEVIKTITAFMNADGGTLVIGICDDGTAYGIQNEFDYLPGNKNQDGWFLRLGNAMEAYLPDYRLVLGYIRQYVVEENGCIYCIIKVDPRKDRITVCKKNGDNDEIVYRRAGNSSLKLQAREIEALVMRRYV